MDTLEFFWEGGGISYGSKRWSLNLEERLVLMSFSFSLAGLTWIRASESDSSRSQGFSLYDWIKSSKIQPWNQKPPDKIFEHLTAAIGSMIGSRIRQLPTRLPVVSQSFKTSLNLKSGWFSTKSISIPMVSQYHSSLLFHFPGQFSEVMKLRPSYRRGRSSEAPVFEVWKGTW